VDSYNSYGITAGEVWNFTTAPPPPGQALQLYPADNAANVSINPKLEWEPAAGATSYNVYLGTGTADWLPIAEVTGTSYTPSALFYGTKYFWKIDARNSGGVPRNYPSFSTARNLSIPGYTKPICPLRVTRWQLHGKQ